MRFDEMQRRVYAQLRDEDKQFITDEDVEAWINQAQRDISHRLNLNMTEATGTVGADGVIAVPDALVEIKILRLGEDDVIFVDDEEFYDNKDALTDPWPSIARVFGSNIEIYPTPSEDQTFTLRYQSYPADLTAGSSESELPEELQDRMVYFAIAQGFYKEREADMGDRFMQMYERGLPGSTLGRGRLQPGPMRIRYEAGPFDYEGTHRG